MRMKRCNRCNELKDRSQFGKNKNASDGLDHYCKECRKKYRAEHKANIAESRARYNKTHREEIRERAKAKYTPHPIIKQTEEERKAKQKQYRLNHREKIMEYGREYRRKNREKCCDLTKRWIENNRDRIKEQKKQYRKDHPDKWKAQHKANKQKRRARIKGNGGTYTAIQLEECLAFFNYRCAYSGEPLEKDYHIDHIVPLSKGGTNDIWNIVPSNREPNLDKSNKDLDGWYRVTEWFDPNRFEKIKTWIVFAKTRYTL